MISGFEVHSIISSPGSGREKLDDKLWTSVSENPSGYSGRRGSLQLWQFLVALLDDPSSAACIAWTGRGLEFKLVEPEEVMYVVPILGHPKKFPFFFFNECFKL